MKTYLKPSIEFIRFDGAHDIITSSCDEICFEDTCVMDSIPCITGDSCLGYQS